MLRTTDRFPTSLSYPRSLKGWFAFLDANELLPNHQLAYKKHHSMEIAVLTVISDALLASDRGEMTLLPAAFDTVDHDSV